MGDLKPCPFCGHDKAYAFYDGLTWWVRCGYSCGCEIGGYKDKQSAIKAWNTRVERTCYDKNKLVREAGLKCALWRCSCCGESYDAEILNYCPNCGAKVVG